MAFRPPGIRAARICASARQRESAKSYTVDIARSGIGSNHKKSKNLSLLSFLAAGPASVSSFLPVCLPISAGERAAAEEKERERPFSAGITDFPVV